MSALSEAIRASMIADPRISAIDDSDKPTDEKSLTALCEAIAAPVEAYVSARLAAAVVTFPPGAIVVAGSAVTQTNPAPVTGGAIT